LPRSDRDLFEEQVGVLTFKAEPTEIGLDRFGDALSRLISGKAPAPVVDISCTHFVPSKYLALVMKAAASARVNGKEVTLIAKPNVGKLFETAGFKGLGRIGTVEG